MIIDQLPSVGTPALTDETVTEQGQNLFKVTWQRLLTLFKANTTPADIGAVDSAGAAAAAPVQSVNGQTGDVTTPVTPLSDATPSPLGTASAGTSTDASRADHVHAMPSASDVGALPNTYPTDWTLAGTSTSMSAVVTYPATAKELLIKARSNYSTNAVAYYLIVPVSAISDINVIAVGGYYSASGDHGIANCNHNATNRTLSYRNIYYASTSGGTFSFYYR